MTKNRKMAENDRNGKQYLKIKQNNEDTVQTKK